ncbi:MAG: KAP family P-loop NTPase fold protein [Tannerellaceae bacterium]
MIRQFIEDKEILLSKDSDLLKTKTYADTLTKLINNTPHNKAFTIGLFGNWGTGKSSIVETSKLELEQQNSKIKFITYDAWKYCNDSFRRMFLLKLREELHYEETELMKKFYSNESTDIGNKYQLSPTRLSFVLGALILLIGIITFIPFKIEYKVPIYAIFTLLGLLITIITGAFHQLKISVTKPHLFAPEQFEECFKEIVSNSLYKSSKILKWINGDNSIQDLEKLVIVIDNIDRCHEAMAYQLLTDIKTFLSNEEYNVVFVVPIDDEALKKHLFEKSKSETCNKEKEEFLRKFFNISLRIKPHQPAEMQSFTHSINDKYSLNFNSDTLALAAKEYATNPRRIIQLLNNLSSELTMYSDEFSEKNQSIICAIIILKEEFYAFYKQAIDDVKLLIDKYEDALKGDDDIKKQTLIFMRSANVYFRNAKLNDIQSILTNTNEQFSSIPNEVKESIRKFDINNVLNVINDNDLQLSTIVGFIVENIKTDVKYSSISQLTNWLDFAAKFNLSYNFSRSTLATLDNMMESKYLEIIKLSQNTMEICHYANMLYNFKLPSLKNNIIIYISSGIDVDEKPINHDSYIRSVLSVFNNEVDSKTLVDFANKYYQNKRIDKNIDYSEAQKKYLFTDYQINNLINTIVSIDDEDKNSELQWLFENKPNILTSTYGELFSQVKNILGDMRNKTKEDLLGYIKFMMLYLCLIKDRILKTELSELYTKLFVERSLAHPNYPMHYQYDTKVNLLSECIDIEEDRETIAKFCYEVYRTTNNNTETKKQFKDLFLKNKPKVNSLFVNLLNLNYSLHPLFSIILTDDDYSDSNNLILTKNCFTQRNGGSLYLTSDQVNNKIKSLIDNIHNLNVTSLIIDIIANEDLKSVFVEDITSRDSEYINSLPSQLLTLAIGAFDKNSSNNFINNYAYLTIVAERGSSKQRSEIVRILSSNFLNNKDTQETLAVFEKMEKIGQKDGNIVIAQLEKYLESYGNDDKSLNDRVEKLLAAFNFMSKKNTKK